MIDSTYRVFKYLPTGWYPLGIIARDISKGIDGSYAYVSNTPSYAGSSDYRIYVIKPNHQIQLIGYGVRVDLWNQ